MVVKILGFDLVSFTNTNTGELISGTRVYYELIRDSLNDNEYGNSCDQVFVKNCIPLSIGGEYEALLVPKRNQGKINYVIGGFASLDSGR